MHTLMDGLRDENPERRLPRGDLELLWPVLVAGLCMLAVFAAGWLPLEKTAQLATQSLVLLIGLYCLWLFVSRMRNHFIHPLRHLGAWAQRSRPLFDPDQGEEDYGEQLPLISRRIGALNDELRNMRDLLDDDDYRQTRTLLRKSRSLQVLYDVAASINIFNDLDDLLTRFLHTLIDVTKARAATVRLLDKDGSVMRLVASVGLSDEELVREGQRSVLASEIQIDVEQMAMEDADRAGENAPQLQRMTVPLRYHGKTLGVYNLLVDQVELDAREDIKDLLTSIGRHLGMAIEKVRVDNQAQRISIMQERNQLAHELHDSLAQTLASLRFQVRVLDDTLQQDDYQEARREALRIKDSLDEANHELRGLLAHFRTPMDERGLLPALEDMIQRFRRETGLVTFFQKECPRPDLPASLELQVLRIIQEALANIRKHSQAHVVRVLLRCNGEGQYHVLVEDDGVGLNRDQNQSREEHFGLSILRERAQRLNGELLIDSEPGEGMRIELTFRNTHDG